MKELLSIFGFKDEDELRDVLIALAVIIFFCWLVYFMGWFKGDVKDVTAPVAVEANLAADTDNDGIVNSLDTCPLVVGVAANAGCPADSDADGIYDSNDECPQVPGVKENAGCAAVAAALVAEAPKPDTDGDGFYDSSDLCPAVPGTVKGCPPDTDEDGVIDAEDTCPAVVGVIENGGCPADADRDGIYDINDSCVNLAGVAANKGCPADQDSDGVYDTADKCPTIKGVKLNNGCPADSDRDGIYDTADKCPTVKGVKVNLGCPADSDKDGIYDTEDKCPNKAGITANNGCPELKITKAEQKAITEAVKNIQFFTNSARPTEKSKVLLQKVADILKANPDYKLKIAGHTDASGDDASNLVLSQKRAFTCFSFLVNSGIASKRLSHAGFGETKPVADNKTKAGRRQNRRVEFELHY